MKVILDGNSSLPDAEVISIARKLLTLLYKEKLNKENNVEIENPWGERKPTPPNSPEIEKQIRDLFVSRIKIETKNGFNCPKCGHKLVRGVCVRQED